MKFELSDEQTADAEKWMAERLTGEGDGPIGGRFTFRFTQTTIGMVVILFDNLTGKSLDLTNYEEM